MKNVTLFKGLIISSFVVLGLLFFVFTFATPAQAGCYQTTCTSTCGGTECQTNCDAQNICGDSTCAECGYPNGAPSVYQNFCPPNGCGGSGGGGNSGGGCGCTGDGSTNRSAGSPPLTLEQMSAFATRLTKIGGEKIIPENYGDKVYFLKIFGDFDGTKRAGDVLKTALKSPTLPVQIINLYFARGSDKLYLLTPSTGTSGERCYKC